MLLRIAPFVGLGAIIGASIGDILPSDVLKLFFMSFIGFAILRTLLVRPTAPDKSGSQASGLRGGSFVSEHSLGRIGRTARTRPAIVLAPFLRRRGFALPVVSAASAALAGLVGAVAAGGYIIGGFDEVGLPAHTLGYLYLPGFGALALGALVGSPLGIRFSHWVKDLLQVRLFVGYLTAVLISMIVHSLAALCGLHPL